MKLKLYREGQFEPVNMRENMERCGQLGVKIIRYAIEVHATDKNLSKEGFVVEQSRLHNYWLSRYCTGKPWEAFSCENMAIKAAMEIGRRLIQEGISVESVMVTIFGADNAKIDATWTVKNDPPKQKAKGKKKVR
jgi:hypothetical protein